MRHKKSSKKAGGISQRTKPRGGRSGQPSRITIPKAIRDKLRLRLGDKVTFVVEEGKVTLEPASTSTKDLLALLPPVSAKPKRGPSTRQIRKIHQTKRLKARRDRQEHVLAPRKATSGSEFNAAGPRIRRTAVPQNIDLWHDCGYIGPMAKTTTIRARIEPKLKAEAEAVLAELGLTPSDAIRLLYHQVRLAKALPFEIAIERTPNAATRKALRDSKRGVGVKRFDNKEAFFRSLGL